MVHALREAWRVLKPSGILIDLRPAIKRPRVGVLRARGFQVIGAADDSYDGARAAYRAVRSVLARGLFRQVTQQMIECDIVSNSRRALGEWLRDYTDLGDLPTHARLVERADAARKRLGRKGKLAARITLVMKILVKATSD